MGDGHLPVASYARHYLRSPFRHGRYLLRVKSALLRYRVMATIVGVLLIVLCLVGVPLKYVHTIWPSVLPEGSSGQHAGEWITQNLGIAHGWLYMIFLLMAFMLSRMARWSIGFTLTTLLSGTVPILSFWAEHRATARVRAEHPETA